MTAALLLALYLTDLADLADLCRHVPPEEVCAQCCQALCRQEEWLRAAAQLAPQHRWDAIDAELCRLRRLHEVWDALWWVAWPRASPAQRLEWARRARELVGDEAWVRQQWPLPW